MLFHHCVKKLLQHGNFHTAYHLAHNMLLLKVFWSRQAASVAI